MAFALRKIFVGLGWLAGLTLGWAQVGTAQDILYFRIGTGPVFGAYFVVGEALGSLISNPPGSPRCEQGGRCGVPNMVASGQASAGSLGNIRDVLAGRLESGLAQADMIQAAAEAKDGGDLRVLANLYPEHVHLVARRELNLTTVSSLRGKRISIDSPQSGTNTEARRILAAYDIGRTQIKLFELPPSVAAEKLAKGELDAMFFVGGAPAPGITDLAQRGLISLVPVAGRGRTNLLKANPLLQKAEIPAGTYKDIPATPTISVNAQWIVSARMDANMAHRITAALWHPQNRDRLDRGGPIVRQISRQTALDTLGAPLHPGAERWYREQGLLKP